MNVASILGLFRLISILIKETLTLFGQVETNEDEIKKAVEEVNEVEVKLKNLEQRIMKKIEK